MNFKNLLLLLSVLVMVTSIFGSYTETYQSSSGKYIYHNVADSNKVILRGSSGQVGYYDCYDFNSCGRGGMSSSSWNWLNSNSCSFSYSGNRIRLNWNPSSVVSDITSFMNSNGLSNALNSNLYPSVKYTLVLQDSSGNQIASRSSSNFNLNLNGQSISSTLINQLKNQAQTKCNDDNNCGNYQIKILSVQTTDSKCTSMPSSPSDSSASGSLVESLNAQPQYDSSHFKFRAEHFDGGINEVPASDIKLISGNRLEFDPRVSLKEGYAPYGQEIIPDDAIIKSQLTITLERLDVSRDGKEFTAVGNLYPRFETKNFSHDFRADGDPADNRINLESKFSNLKSGKYRVSELKINVTESMQTHKPYHSTLAPSTQSGPFYYTNSTNFTKLFCGSNDDDCDSITNDKDVCQTYGSAFYLGCKQEFIPIDASDPVLRYNKKAINCIEDSPGVFNAGGKLVYDSNNDNIFCDVSNAITFGSDYVTKGSSFLGNEPISSNGEGLYKCYNVDGNHDFTGSSCLLSMPLIGCLIQDPSDDFVGSCELVDDGYPVNAISVFDLDSDFLRYTPQWWLNTFNAGVSYNEDECPPSFGLTVDRGCPRTNREDVSELGNNELTFDDLIEYKLTFDEETGEVFFNNSLIYSFSQNKISDISVDISTSCIPTNRLSQISEVSKVRLAAQIPTLAPVAVATTITPTELAVEMLPTVGVVSIDEAESLGLEHKDYLINIGQISALSIQDKKNLYAKIQSTGDCDRPIARSDNLTVSGVLSALHYLIPIDDNQRTIDAITSIIDVSSDLEISKEIQPYETSTKVNTIIDLDITDIPPNTTVWQVIPKESVYNVYDLYDSIRIGNADEIRVKDKDPVIGWYFEDGGDSGDIGFEINGTGEGGSTIPIEDTIYYNFGQLIINYREFECFDDERELFSVDNVTGSEIQVGSPRKTYSVCVAQNGTDIINSSAGIFEQWFGVTSNRFDKDVLNIELYKETPVVNYYMTQYGQYPPSPGFSCLGSLRDNGLFGDCLMNPSDRIWMYYGPDIFPPEFEVGVYVPANSISFEILVTDDISGVNWSTIEYCISDDESQCSSYQLYLENEKVDVVCPDVESCFKKLFVKGSDIEGNFGEFNQTLDLLQVDSSCDTQCLAKPHPDRYIKSCRKVNGCEFYKLANETTEQRGEYVSNLCHYKIEGSWVSLAPGLEVQCPNGPIRSARATDEDFQVDSRICENIQTERFPTVIDGEEVVMHIITCND